MGTVAAGWYADERGEAEYRWWDGNSWTDGVFSPSKGEQPPSVERPVAPLVTGITIQQTTPEQSPPGVQSALPPTPPTTYQRIPMKNPANLRVHSMTPGAQRGVIVAIVIGSFIVVISFALIFNAMMTTTP